MKLLYGGIIIMAMLNLLTAQEHHDGNGFRNPYPGYEERNVTDVFKWAVVDRVKGERPDRPDSYDFPIVRNDGNLLRNNKSDFSVTWVGHSTLLIQIDGMNILTDPIWSDRASPVSFAGPKRYVKPALKWKDLPSIDVVLVSHNHYDHLDKSTIQRLGNAPIYFIPLGVGDTFLKWGIKNFIELDWWDQNKFNAITFTCLPAQHFSGRTMMDRDKTLWASWLINGKKIKFYYGGDSGYFPGYKEIGEKFGPIDIAALPIGAFRPAWFMGPVHMNPKESLRAMEDLKAQNYIPIHWGTFDLADDFLDEAPRLLEKAIKKSEMDSTRFWVLKHGETRWLNNEKTEHNSQDSQVNN